MPVRSIHSLMLLAVLSLVGSVGAQTTAEDGVAVDLEVKLRALETMNAAAASKLQDALNHQSLLEGYVKSVGLETTCGEVSSNDQHDMAMSFEQALRVAIDNEQSAPTAAATGTATSGTVTAYTTLARSTWDKLQTAMAGVQHLSDCLNSQGKLDEYNAWERDQAKAHHEAMAAKEKEVAQANQKKDEATNKELSEQYKTWQVARKKQHEEYLKHAWTRYKFDTNANLKAYKYSQQYGPNSYNQTYAGNRYGGGGGYGYGYRGAY
jgi:hypothetical protein